MCLISAKKTAIWVSVFRFKIGLLCCQLMEIPSHLYYLNQFFGGWALSVLKRNTYWARGIDIALCGQQTVGYLRDYLAAAAWLIYSSISLENPHGRCGIKYLSEIRTEITLTFTESCHFLVKTKMVKTLGLGFL